MKAAIWGELVVDCRALSWFVFFLRIKITERTTGKRPSGTAFKMVLYADEGYRGCGNVTRLTLALLSSTSLNESCF